MFRRTDPQESLLDNQFLLPPEKRARLERSWAHEFRTRVLPLIDEEVYRGSFSATTGRPNRSIRLMTGLELLKHWHDLTDRDLVEQLEFNLQFQYALGVTAAEAHIERKLLHDHRVRTLQNGGAQEMFERVTRGLAELDGLSLKLQRLDSSHVMSHIAQLTRLGLMVETLTKFLRALDKEAPEKLAGLGATLRQRYLDREGYFADVKKEQARRRLLVVARDLYRVIEAFAQDARVQAMDSFVLVARVFNEQCEVIDKDDGVSGGGDGVSGADRSADSDGAGEGEADPRIQLREGKKISGQSLQSPHDPDATYGHKGKGYEVQVSETCVEENPYQVITHVSVNGAHESDQRATPEVIDDLYEAGMAPEELLADTGYGSGENIIDAAVNGVSLLAPVQDPNAPVKRDTFIEPVAVVRSGTEEERVLGLGDFQFNNIFNEVLACPAGCAPTANEVDDERREPYAARFDGAGCSGCPLAGLCPARESRGSKERILRWRDVKAATATRQREQRETPFKERYRLRSGIEATNSELKGRHGADDLRVRGRARVEMVMVFKALALNVKRACQASISSLSAPTCEAAPA